jgi:hypothetical protein
VFAAMVITTATSPCPCVGVISTHGASLVNRHGQSRVAATVAFRLLPAGGREGGTPVSALWHLACVGALICEALFVPHPAHSNRGTNAIQRMRTDAALHLSRQSSPLYCHDVVKKQVSTGVT